MQGIYQLQWPQVLHCMFLLDICCRWRCLYLSHRFPQDTSCILRLLCFVDMSPANTMCNCLVVFLCLFGRAQYHKLNSRHLKTFPVQFGMFQYHTIDNNPYHNLSDMFQKHIENNMTVLCQIGNFQCHIFGNMWIGPLLFQVDKFLSHTVCTWLLGSLQFQFDKFLLHIESNH